jgi:glycosyltransferase involved in cell wall biosynthesis
MKLGVLWFYNSAANYRALQPMQAMARRGHDVIGPAGEDGAVPLERLLDCDVVHVYRRHDPSTTVLAKALKQRGISLVWDNDDDFTSHPRDSPGYDKRGGARGRQRFADSVRMAKLATAVTLTTEPLRTRYREAGVERVHVIENALAPGTPRAARPHDGIVIGWIAGDEHAADLARIPIADALRRVVEKHADVRVECIGLDLKLPERYRHDRFVPFGELPRRISGFDIGVAPLADLPFNASRSSIKLKEYAASGVPWLASPVGPYAGLGENQGGRLVPDDGWFEALDALVRRARDRRRLSRKAKTWAKSQTIEATADRWEHVFVQAAAARRGADR